MNIEKITEDLQDIYSEWITQEANIDIENINFNVPILQLTGELVLSIPNDADERLRERITNYLRDHINENPTRH